MRIIFIILLFVILQPGAFLLAQNSTPPPDSNVMAEKKTADKVPEEFPHSAKKALILSAVVPGLGQAYNHKYWKIPVIYGGFAVIAYFINDNFKSYNIYGDEFAARMLEDTFNLNPGLALYSTGDVLELKNYYRRLLDISVMSAGVLYILNLIDANVDGHLFYFNVGDDLSMRILPYHQYQNNNFSSGVNLSLRF